MAPEEEPKPEITQQQAGARSSGRRDRRPSRGRRGRGRGGRPKPATHDRPEGQGAPATVPQEESEAIFELASEADQTSEAPTADVEAPEPVQEQEHAPAAPTREPGQRAAPATVEQAIEEVSAVVESLRTSLDEMEEVLEMLELFERQKNADEREIESLRRAVRQINRPRDTGHHHHR